MKKKIVIITIILVSISLVSNILYPHFFSRIYHEITSKSLDLEVGTIEFEDKEYKIINFYQESDEIIYFSIKYKDDKKSYKIIKYNMQNKEKELTNYKFINDAFFKPYTFDIENNEIKGFAYLNDYNYHFTLKNNYTSQKINIMENNLIKSTINVLSDDESGEVDIPKIGLSNKGQFILIGNKLYLTENGKEIFEFTGKLDSNDETTNLDFAVDANKDNNYIIFGNKELYKCIDKDCKPVSLVKKNAFRYRYYFSQSDVLVIKKLSKAVGNYPTQDVYNDGKLIATVKGYYTGRFGNKIFSYKPSIIKGKCLLEEYDMKTNKTKNYVISVPNNPDNPYANNIFDRPFEADFKKDKKIAYDKYSNVLYFVDSNGNLSVLNLNK